MMASPAQHRHKWKKARRSRKSPIKCPHRISSLHRAAALTDQPAPEPSRSHQTIRRSPSANTAKTPRALNTTTQWFTSSSKNLVMPLIRMGRAAPGLFAMDKMFFERGHLARGHADAPGASRNFVYVFPRSEERRV